MKYVLLLLSLVSLAYCATSCSSRVPSTAEDCLAASREDGYSCCYLKATKWMDNEEVMKCLEVNTTYVEDDDYKNNYIKVLEIIYKKVKKLVCK